MENHIIKVMSSQVSQLSLIRIATAPASKCAVFCEINSRLDKYEVVVDDDTTVEGLITKTLALVRKAHSSSDITGGKGHCELFASKKHGRKVSDLPSFDKRQKLSQTGVRYFYLSNVEIGVSRKRNIGSVSTRSIQTEMLPLQQKRKEVMALKTQGCLCFA
jgi:hypothetical protein